MIKRNNKQQIGTKMKTLKILTILFLALLLFSCENNSKITEPDVNNQRTSEEYIAQIEAMGFDIESVEEMENSFLVEGCIELTKDYLDSEHGILEKPSQRRSPYIVSYARISNVITVYANYTVNSAWKTAVQEAVTAWNNNISDTKVHFQYVTSGSHDVTVSAVYDSLQRYNIAKVLNWPTSSGEPGEDIQINYAYEDLVNNNVSSHTRKWTIAHELGHIIGLYHTDLPSWYIQIPRTPTSDANSIMNGGIASSFTSSTNFSYYDKKAVQVLYPSVLSATITGIQTIPDEPRDYFRVNFTHNGLYSTAKLWGLNENTQQWEKPYVKYAADTYFDILYEYYDAFKINLFNTKTDKDWWSNVYWR